VCHLIRTLPTFYLPTFGGGALAHLVDHHGETLIDWIEREAAHNVNFRTALSSALVVGEGVHPTLLIRLRVAAGARIRVARRAKRDAVYQTMFEGWVIGHPPRAIRHPRRTDVPKELLHGKSAPPFVAPPLSRSLLFGMRLSTRLLTFQIGMYDKPRYLRDMAHGAVAVWYSWLLLTIMAARFVLPVLLLVLCIVSASAATDLMLVVLAFVLTTIAAAVAGLVLRPAPQRQHGIPTPLMYLSMLSVIPYLTVVGLIARAEHGIFVAPAAIAGLIVRPYLWRLVRRARAAVALRAAHTAVH
jgi:hypothetical protein